MRPAVLLRDTPEDRERLIAALDHMTLTGQDDPFLELIWTNRSDEGDGGASSLALPQEVADAIIAALRVDGTSTRIESDSTRGER